MFLAKWLNQVWNKYLLKCACFYGESILKTEKNIIVLPLNT